MSELHIIQLLSMRKTLHRFYNSAPENLIFIGSGPKELICAFNS